MSDFLKYVHWFRSIFFFPFWGGVFVLAFLGSFFLFQFDSSPHFRDFVGSPYYFHLDFELSVSYIWKIFLNGLSSMGVEEGVRFGMVFAFYFSFSFTVLYSAIQKLVDLYSFKNKGLNRIFALLLSACVLGSPWVVERFIMGQLGIVLGMCVLFFVVACVLECIDCIKTQRPFGRALALVYAGIGFGTLLTPHYTILGIFFFLVGIGYLGGVYWKEVVSFFWSRCGMKPWGWGVFWRGIGICIAVFAPLLIFWLRYSQDQYTAFLSSEYSQEIITLFSLWTGGEYFLLESLIGKNSWMRGGFVEENLMESYLGIFSKGTLFFNEYLIGGAVMVICGIAVYTLWILIQQQKFFMVLCLFGILGISLWLNFGYSFGINPFTQWFYSLPYSYLFREGGKFYGIVLLCMVYISILCFVHIKKREQIVFLGGMGGIAVSGILPFFVLAQSLPQPLYPNIFYDLEKECTAEKKILFLPLVQYTRMAYSPEVFSLTPEKYFFSCGYIDHSFTYLGNDNIPLSNDIRYESLRVQIELFISDASKNNYLDLLSKLRQDGVSYLVIDTTSNDMNTEVFVKNLFRYQSPQWQEGSISIFTILLDE